MKPFAPVEKGFSIVEILISITLGLIVMGGILQLFLNNKFTYRLEQGFTELQENGRFLMTYLNRIVRLSAYRTTPDVDSFMTLEETFPIAAPHVSGTNDNGVNGSDTLTVRFQGSGDGAGNPDGTLSDCLNTNLDANDIAINIFSINANFQFQCQAINATSNTDQTLVLIDGVEDFQVLMGEDLNDDNTPDRYVPSNYPNLNFQNVISVRLALLLRTNDEVSASVENKVYNLLGNPFTPGQDRRLRKTFATTVFLRNVHND